LSSLSFFFLLLVDSPTPTPLPENRAFDIEGGGVHYGFGDGLTPAEVGDLDEHQCVTDGPDHYGDHEDATITVRRHGAINSKGTFHTEHASWSETYYHDYLTIGTSYYGGSNAPMNVEVNQGDTFTWNSDSSITQHGWTVCLEEYVAPTAPPTLSPTDAPTDAPTLNPTGTCTVSFSSFIVLPAIAHV